MFSLWPDVDIPAIAVLVPKPRDRPCQRIPVPHSGNHDRFAILSVGLEKADLKYFRGHGFDLALDGVHRPVASRHVERAP
jgi:hypothetical protein